MMFNEEIKDLRERLDLLATKRELGQFLQTLTTGPSRRWTQKFKAGDVGDIRIGQLTGLARALDKWERQHR